MSPPDTAGGPATGNPHAPERHGPLSFDGIRELDSRPPRMWTAIYGITIAAAIWLIVAYPAIPWLTHGGADGLLGWGSRAALVTASERATTQEPSVQARFAQADFAAIEADPALRAYAVAAGASAFGTHCAGCHGRGGLGNAGFPNLRDRDWLWGGTAAAIEHTIQVGIRWPGTDATRTSQMPAFGKLGVLDRAQILDLTEYVRGLSGAEHDAAAAGRAAPVFAENCVACHGEAGLGNQELGSPNLADQVWLYGGTRAALYETIHNARAGIMPALGGRLDADTIRKLVVYVRQFGGGE